MKKANNPVSKFWALTSEKKWELCQSMGVLSPKEMTQPVVPRYRLLFRRAQERGCLGALTFKIEKAHKELVESKQCQG